MKKLIYLVLFFACMHFSNAQDSKTNSWSAEDKKTFEAANKLFNKRFYAQAYEKYKSLFALLMVQRCLNKFGKQGMRPARARLEFGVELAAQEPGVVYYLHYFNQPAVRRGAADMQAVFLERIPKFIVDLEAMAMPFVDVPLAVSIVGKRGVF